MPLEDSPESFHAGQMALFTALRYGLSGLMLAASLAVTHPALAGMISKT
jgi:hypothetical protein